jgi:hypothetical protein
MTLPTPDNTGYSFAPSKCPVCFREYDSAIRPNVNQLWKLWVALRQIGQRVSFVIDLPEEKTAEAKTDTQIPATR